MMTSSSTLLQTALTNPLSPKLPNQISTTLTDTLTGKKIAFAKLSDIAGDFAANLAIALLILTVTLWLATWAARLARGAIRHLPRVNQDETLQGFVASLTRYGVITVGVIAILHRLGFETTSIITVLGAASLAIGLALQGALSNVAAGVMILMFRPYRVGDFITIAGKSGTVKRLDLFNTELSDSDGLKVVVPNGKGFGDVIVNYTDIPNRRIELHFRIMYEEDVDAALATILRSANAEPRLLKTPAPWAKATELQPDAVIVTLRAWTDLEGYWDTRFDMLKGLRDALTQAGIGVAYPTQGAPPAPTVQTPSSPGTGR
jgi:small conductance mechanosensitive channel